MDNLYYNGTLYYINKSGFLNEENSIITNLNIILQDSDDNQCDKLIQILNGKKTNGEKKSDGENTNSNNAVINPVSDESKKAADNATNAARIITPDSPSGNGSSSGSSSGNGSSSDNTFPTYY